MFAVRGGGGAAWVVSALGRGLRLAEALLVPGENKARFEAALGESKRLKRSSFGLLLGSWANVQLRWGLITS